MPRPRRIDLFVAALAVLGTLSCRDATSPWNAATVLGAPANRSVTVVPLLKAGAAPKFISFVPSTVDDVSGTEPRVGQKGYFIALTNASTIPVTNATITVASGWPVNTFPSISSLPMIAGPVTIAPGVQFGEIFPSALRLTRIVATSVTGFDVHRSADVTTIPVGGGQQTIRVAVRLTELTLDNNQTDLTVSVSNRAPGVATVVSSTPPSNLNEGEILGSAGGAPGAAKNWSLNRTRLLKEYVFAVTLQLPNALDAPYDTKPAITVTIVPHRPSYTMPRGTSIVVPEATLDGPTPGSGLQTYSVDQESDWQIIVNDARIHSLLGFFKRGVKDNTPPVVTHTVSGTPSQAGWYNTDLSVIFAAADAESPVTTSGCEARTVTANTSVDGVTFTCVATSSGGTTTDPVTIKRDAAKPSIEYSGNAGSYAVDQTVAITCSASDALSGLASTTCRDISGPAYSFEIGANSYAATAMDNADNSNAAAASFTVTVSGPSLCALVMRFVANAGVANSMCTKIEQRSYGALRNELSAQAGKKLTEVNAAVLLRLVGVLDPR